MRKKQLLEPVLREQAFKLYKKFRNLKEVASIPGMPSITVLRRWKQEDDWDNRIQKIERNIEKWSELLAKVESDGILKDDLAHLLLLNFLLERTLKTVFEEDLKPQNWRDVLDTIKLIFEQKRIMLGRTTSKSEVILDLQDKSEEELRAILKQIQSMIAEHSDIKPLAKKVVEKAIEKPEPTKEDTVQIIKDDFLEDIE